MRRREFLAALAAASAEWPSRGGAQTANAPVVGFLNGGSPYEWAPFVAAFRAGLSEMGYAEGRNITIEFRWAYGDQNLMPSLVRDLVNRRVDAIVTSAGNLPTRVALQATSTIPIIATFGNQEILDEIGPTTKNVTGVSLIAPSLIGKQLGLLRQIAPKASLIAVLMDPLPTSVAPSEYQETARQIGQQLTLIPASTDPEIDKAFTTMKDRGAGALLVSSTAYFLGRRDRLASLAARYAIPAMYPARAYADAGGLLSYGVDRQDLYRNLGLYTGRILRGNATPADLPVHQPTKFELAINLKTSKALGITIPPSMITLADVVLE